MLTILRLVEYGELELLSSVALAFEVDRMPDAERQTRARDMLKLASETMELVDEIEAQADDLVHEGLRPLDALHVALASRAKAEYFCTV